MYRNRKRALAGKVIFPFNEEREWCITTLPLIQIRDGLQNPIMRMVGIISLCLYVVPLFNYLLKQGNEEGCIRLVLQ